MVFKVCALYSHPFLKCPKLTECITHSYVELSFDSFQTSELYESLPPTSSSTSLQTPLRLAPHLVNVGRALTRAIRSRIVSRIMAKSGKRIVRSGEGLLLLGGLGREGDSVPGGTWRSSWLKREEYVQLIQLEPCWRYKADTAPSILAEPPESILPLPAYRLLSSPPLT
jgi:hypothetical protein